MVAAGLSLERCVCYHEAVGPQGILDPVFLDSFGNARLNLFTSFELPLAAQRLVRGTICPAY